MKKGIVILFATILPFMLFGCVEAHKHNLKVEYTYDEQEHWKECLDCEEKVGVSAHTFEEKITKHQTHSEVGTKTYTCSVCGYSYIEEIPMLTEHLFDREIPDLKHLKENATCVSPAIYYKSCICGEIGTETFEFGATKDHTFKTYIPNNDATCTHDGTKTAKCEYCDETNTITDPKTKLEHDLEYHDAKQPTCEEIGWNNYVSCKNCNYTTYEELPALGHDLVHHNGVASTCDYGGWKEYDTCNRCDYTTFKREDPLGHDLIHHEGKESTCSEPGWKEYDTCSRCNYTTYTQLPLEPHPYNENWSYDQYFHYHEFTCEHDGKLDYDSHSFNMEITAAATHTTVGIKTYTCSVCGYSYTEEINKLTNHTYDLEIVDNKYLKEPATCTSQAIYYKSCACGEKGTETFVYGQLEAHSFTNYISNNDATCTNDGTKTAKCDYCDATDTIIDENSKLGHNLEHHDAQAPTCVDYGWEAYDTCSRCDYTTYNELSVLGHDLIHHEAKEVTCEECGWDEYDTCSRCDYSTYVEIPKTGHIYNPEWSYDETNHWHEAICGHDLTSDFEKHSYEGQGVFTIQPTHTSEGIAIYYCKCGYSYSVTLPKTKEHTFDKMVVDEKHLKSEATCTSPAIYYMSCVCGEIGTETFTSGDPTPHDLIHHDAKSPTCTEIGWDEYDTCSGCDYTTYVEIPAIGHAYEIGNDTCLRCDHKFYTLTGDNGILFGSYPQSLESDETINEMLLELAGTLPTLDNLYDWNVYPYYIDGEITNYMYYIDLDIDNDGRYDYRGVYFTSYRPIWTTDKGSSSNSYQDDNNYLTENVYFFKFEPVKWTILCVKNGLFTILADLILDSQDYGAGCSYLTYELSHIRSWLNDTFYNTCFDEYEKQFIATATVDNSLSSTGDDNNPNICNNTQDKIFLPSKYEIISYTVDEEDRIKYGTDYALCQGLYCDADTTINDHNSSYYMLRTQSANYSNYVCYVKSDGSIVSENYILTNVGITPACMIYLIPQN